MAGKQLSQTVSIDLDITQLADDFEDGMTKALQAVAQAVLQELVVKTPIDVGTAKSNWQVDLNGQASGTVPASAPGKGGSTFNANISYTVYKGEQDIARAKFSDEINITNNLDYIEDLNNGTSLQAPAGFVEDAVVQGIQAVNNVKIIP